MRNVFAVLERSGTRRQPSETFSAGKYFTNAKHLFHICVRKYFTHSVRNEFHCQDLLANPDLRRPVVGSRTRTEFPSGMTINNILQGRYMT